MPDPYLWDQVARRLGFDLGDMLDLTNDWYATDAFTGASKLRKDTYLALPLAWEPISTGDKVLLPEWGGNKVRIPLEDDAVLTERGVEWLYPANEALLLVK